MSTQKTDIETLADLIADIQVAMFTTVLPNGQLHSRPMATQRERFAGTLWFMTEASSNKMDDIAWNGRVNLAYAKPSDQAYVSVSGKASMVNDRATIHELWSPFYRAWFPKGPDDPEIALIRVDVDGAEYWKGPPSKVVKLVGFVKAIVTGERYEGGEHRKVDVAKAKVS